MIEILKVQLNNAILNMYKNGEKNFLLYNGIVK